MSRSQSEYLNEHIDTDFTFKVLDDGFIKVVDYMGTDASVVQAARVSYGAGTKKVNEDQALLNHLMRMRHTSPFEMCELKIHVRVPMDAWRQWIRHRTASVNEYSTRYSEAIDSMQSANGEWREQSTTNKQGSGGLLSVEDMMRLSADETNIHRQLKAVYQRRLKMGVAREQARKDLPLSTYTEAYWKIDLHNLLHFLRLRLNPAAQKEIREYAQVLASIVSKWVPQTWLAFENYQLNAITLSDCEQSVLCMIMDGGSKQTALQSIVNQRERAGLENKLSLLGF